MIYVDKWKRKIYVNITVFYMSVYLYIWNKG
jgi:hypothetical protein